MSKSNKPNSLWDTDDPLLKDICGLHPEHDLSLSDHGVQVFEFWTPQLRRDRNGPVSLIHVDYGRQEVAHLYIPRSRKGNLLYSKGKLTNMGGFRPGNQWHPSPDRVQEFYRHREKYINRIQFLGAKNIRTDVINEVGRKTVEELERAS